MYYGSYIHWGMDGLNGSPQGEQIQWHDLYVSLVLLGYNPTLVHTKKQVTSEYLEAFDIVIIDYAGVSEVMDDVALQRNRCKLRLLDSWGTDAGPNSGPRRRGSPFCCLALPSLSQFWTFTPKGPSPANSYLGYSVRSFRPLLEFQDNAVAKRKLEVLLYGKEYKFFKDDIQYIQKLSNFAKTHATAMGWPPGVLADVNNHGVLGPGSLHELMQQTFAYAGFPAVMMGPAAIEALSQGMIFLNYAFVPPVNLSVTQGKPTTQLWTSQFPFLETQQPHAVTINARDPLDVAAKLQMVRDVYDRWWVRGEYEQLKADAIIGPYVFLAKTKGHRMGYVPYEYTSVAMLQRVRTLVQQNFCKILSS